MDIAWLPEYSIGIDDVDDQHKHLLQLLGRVGRAAGNGGEVRNLSKLIDDLHEYAAYHFGSEEHLMHAAVLPAGHLQQHIAEHRQYWREVAELQRRLQAGDHTVASALNDFLRHWWLDHICRIDRELGRLLLNATKAG